ncbi:sulfate transporter family-domain-containing protein [Thamnocephalis sphaerospora]|uniref:Sulfate transporter family-domain-containing protein n=1 Tax=Thamnocephalis sphaerospora TaxID=78915 RepID=A0A4P9XTA4_9FUNG|nr:sulfate transporter family-domain-containing protein [Thamnocephalis sphaerospora]|eukprot:RKP09398.1 sulfate transporter family-domain-containing protein [Thamnocephalis sphaerospora]
MPAVVVGTLVNVLGAVSYGMIIFPLALPLFADFALDGVAMYLISSIVSQLVYSAGGSAFPGAPPTFRASKVLEEVGPQNPHTVTSTTMVAYAASAIITGIVFLLLGYFKLGSLIGFFPRHILVGCIGGVGWFLVLTAIEVASGVKPEHGHWGELLGSRALPLWTAGLALAIILQILLHRTNHPLTVPGFLLGVPLLFYIIAGIFGFSLDELRDHGWLFRLPSPMRPFYEVYRRFDFASTDWTVLPKTIPAILALTFFSILHVPINVPALSVTTAQDGVDLSHELQAHGISNIISGLLGSVQNYLVYSNSVLFIRCGGNNRVAGVALAICTLMAFFVGPGMIAYVPVAAVASLIFHLGLELMKEAVYHPWGRVHPLEYATIVAIILSMAILGFIEGVLVGALLACVFFVVIYSRRRAVRRWLTGGLGGARSAVRRPARQRQYLDALGQQIHLLELQGFLFFGTVNTLEELVENIVSGQVSAGPIVRFIIMDFSLVTGMDFSAAEALVRVKRALSAHDVCLVIAGVAANSETGHALQSVGVWGGTTLDVYIQNARTARQAVEWCENQLLKCYYDHADELSCVLDHQRRPSVSQFASPITVPRSIEPDVDHAIDMFQPGLMTPRTEMIAQAARHLELDDMAAAVVEQKPRNAVHAVPSDGVAFEASALMEVSAAFTRVFVNRGQRLWRAGDASDAMYLLERGILVLLADSATTSVVVETILPGALIGSSGMITGVLRRLHLVAESDATVWRLSADAYAQLSRQHPHAAVWLVTSLMAIYTNAAVLRH